MMEHNDKTVGMICVTALIIACLGLVAWRGSDVFTPALSTIVSSALTGFFGIMVGRSDYLNMMIAKMKGKPQDS